MAKTAKLKKYLKMAKGFKGRGKNCKRIVYNRVDKALEHSYASRKLKKRDMRKLWISQLNAAAREHGVSYSRLIDGMNKQQIALSRNVLAEMAINEPCSFFSVLSASRLPSSNLRPSFETQ